MPNILHRVGIQSSPEKVFEAISTPEELSHWWVTNTTGEGKVGGHIQFLPEGGNFKMKVEELVPSKLIKWKCVDGPKEWIGTEIIFRLEFKENQTFVIFKHANWKEEIEFMHHCSTKWAIFLMSLKSWLERKEGRPLPYDVKIHIGD